MPGSHRERRGGRLNELGSLPFVAFLLVGLNGLYLAAIAFGNITDYDTNWAFVQHVLAMDTTNFGAPEGTNLDDDVMWRAIGNEAIQRIAYLGIIAWETVTAAILLVATAIAAWEWRQRASLTPARSLATIGLAMMLSLFFGGFIVIGGEWFQMWKSDAWNGLDPAFRNSVLALLTLVLLYLPAARWDPTQRFTG